MTSSPEARLSLEQKKVEDKKKYMAEIIYQFFGVDPAGKELLEYLKRQYLLNPVAPWHIGKNYAYYREGENSIIRQFLSIVENKGKLNEGNHADTSSNSESNSVI